MKNIEVNEQNKQNKAIYSKFILFYLLLDADENAWNSVFSQVLQRRFGVPNTISPKKYFVSDFMLEKRGELWFFKVMFSYSNQKQLFQGTVYSYYYVDYCWDIEVQIFTKILGKWQFKALFIVTSPCVFSLD